MFFIGCSGTQNISQSSDSYTPVNQEDISYQQFYDGLSPYGRWVDYPGYGNVWVPMDQGFRPYYSNGHWAYTSYGWTWVSGYEWGWATFHYGRWFQDNNYGWVWTPGYEWAPAWVSWRSDNQYYGWAPIGPSGRYEDIDDRHWAFVRHEYINQRNINNYYINQQNNRNIINNTTIINNYNSGAPVRTFNPGPSVKEVEAITKTVIRPLKVNESPLPGITKINNNTLTIYKPTAKPDGKVIINNNDPKNLFPSNRNNNQPVRQITVQPQHTPVTIQPVNNAPARVEPPKTEPKKLDQNIIIKRDPPRPDVNTNDMPAQNPQAPVKRFGRADLPSNNPQQHYQQQPYRQQVNPNPNRPVYNRPPATFPNPSKPFINNQIHSAPPPQVSTPRPKQNADKQP